mmetsp:Transcript_17151/g.27201  ORF Transcript_17151/g.27201 Transcript_17151/m.27201 type:complete len:194 (+) Transcript_17151:63-644(+)
MASKARHAARGVDKGGSFLPTPIDEHRRVAPSSRSASHGHRESAPLAAARLEGVRGSTAPAGSHRCREVAFGHQRAADHVAYKLRAPWQAATICAPKAHFRGSASLESMHLIDQDAPANKHLSQLLSSTAGSRRDKGVIDRPGKRAFPPISELNSSWCNQPRSQTAPPRSRLPPLHETPAGMPTTASRGHPRR